MEDTDKGFLGSIPELYHTYLKPFFDGKPAHGTFRSMTPHSMR